MENKSWLYTEYTYIWNLNVIFWTPWIYVTIRTHVSVIITDGHVCIVYVLWWWWFMHSRMVGGKMCDLKIRYENRRGVYIYTPNGLNTHERGEGGKFGKLALVGQLKNNFRSEKKCSYKNHMIGTILITVWNLSILWEIFCFQNRSIDR